MNLLSWIVAWVRAHPAECWLVTSAVVNTLLRVRTADAWVRLACARWRFVAAVVAFSRSWGVDPAGVIETLATLVAARAAGAAVGRMGEGNGPPTMRNPPPNGGDSDGP